MRKLAISLFALAFFMFTARNSDAQQSTNQTAAATTQVIQFHLEHRCVTCLKIEKLTRTTLKNYFPSIPFSLVNVEEKKNEKMAEEFEATGSALFLYNTKTGKKKNLTEFAFMKAGNEKLFDTELKNYIEEFLKG
jgi:hypothetical protein